MFYCLVYNVGMFEQSKRALSDIVYILERILYAFSIILFVVFTGFYCYQIVIHAHDGALIEIIYGILIAIHTTTFVLSKTTKIDRGLSHAERYEFKTKIRKRKRIFKIIKLSVNTAAIIWNIVEVFQGGVSDLRIMILIISAVLLFAQIIMEVVINLWVYYFDNLRIAFIEDIKSIDMDSNIVTKFVTKSLGIKKALKDVRSDDYFSEEEKKIVEKQKRRK